MSKALGFTAAFSWIQVPTPHVVLTFDDGPDQVDTPRVLDVLHRHGAHATFFVLGTRAHRFPSLLSEIVAEGHEVALHGSDHRRASEFTRPQLVERTRSARIAIEDRVGQAIVHVRPPYGEQTIGWARAARRLGLATVLWGPSVRDSEHVDDHTRITGGTAGVRAGDILLAHDAFAGPEDGVNDGARPSVDRARLISEVLSRYDESGLAACSVREALQHGHPARGPRLAIRPH